MKVLVDEAHGTHFYFWRESAGFSNGGRGRYGICEYAQIRRKSHTEFLVGPSMHAGYVRQIINLTQTTSGSYLLLSSLDISRRNLVLRGKESFARVAALADYARERDQSDRRILCIFKKELINGDSIYDFDTTKLSIHTLEMVLRESRSMIFCGMSMIFRSNLEISGIFWHICLSETGSRRLSVW